MGDPQWLAYLDQVKTQVQGGTNPDFAARLTALLDAQGAAAPPPPGHNQGGGDRLRGSGGLLNSDDDASSTSGRTASSHYEKIPTDIPIQKFPYGKPGADLREYAKRFRRAVKTVTNAATEERLDELCLMWFPLKLPDEAQSIYQGCQHKDSDWNLLVEELEEKMEDPVIRRNWVRDLGAYKRPAGMSLQVYKANVLGYVHKYSPAVVHCPKSYEMECYNRFVHGLELDWREAIDAGIPFGKETMERAYNQAIKYELRRKESKQVGFTGAAMTDSERDQMQRLRLEVAEVKTEVDSIKRSRSRDRHDKSGSRSHSPNSYKKNHFHKVRNHKNSPHHSCNREERRSSRSREDGYRSSTSGKSGSSTSRSRSQSREDYRAIQTADEDSDSEVIGARAKAMTESISKAILEGMKGLGVKSRKGSSSSTASTASAGRSSGKSKSKSKN